MKKLITLITVFLVFFSFAGCLTQNKAKLYRLREAYDLGILTYEDLFEISFYNNDGTFGVPYGAAISRTAYPKTPEFLSEQTEKKIKQAFLYDYKTNHDDTASYTTENISIVNYCGTYNGAVVVLLEGLYHYTEAESSETIADITFYYNNGNYLRVWVDQSDQANVQSVPFIVAATQNSMSSRENHTLLTIIRSSEELNTATATRYYEYYTDEPQPHYDYYLANLTEKYDDAFFVENALVLYLFEAANTGGTVDIIGLERQGNTLTITKDFHMGMATAISYWTVILEVAKADIVGISKIENKDMCECPILSH